jgi:hypothetical protein
MQPRLTASIFIILGIVALPLLGLSGCGSRPAANATEAIQAARDLKTPEAQAEYLIAQAKTFLAAKDYQEAGKTAQYVLSSVDSQSEEAQQVLADAKLQVANDAQQAIGDAKQKLGL